MAKLSGDEIRELAKTLVLSSANGMRFSALVEEIERQSPETPHGTVMGNVNGLEHSYPTEISKPARGLFVAADRPEQPTPPSPTIYESAFYAPFADFLRAGLDEVTSAEPLGGAVLGKKWGTPDVIGVYRPTSADLVRFQPEIIAVEIKIDPSQTVVAFGQAVAYRLFANASYLVLPRTIDAEERALLKDRCRLAGIGLVFFDLNAEMPNFEADLLAVSSPTDMFHTNRFAESLHRHDREKFTRLFG